METSAISIPLIDSRSIVLFAKFSRAEFSCDSWKVDPSRFEEVKFIAKYFFSFVRQSPPSPQYFLAKQP